MLPFFSESKYQLWNEIRGWLLPEAAQELYRHASMAPQEADFVEIGSYAGKSTVCIMQAMSDRGDLGSGLRLTAMDLRFQPDFQKNMALFGHQGRVNTMNGPNINAFDYWCHPIGFIYIDGHHGKGHALADLLLWDIHIVNGGIVALDDTAGFMVGPNLQIQAAVRTGAYELLAETGGISFLRKIKPILPVGEAELSSGALMAELHAISAGVGAMDPAFRLPRYPRQAPMPLRGWFDVLLLSSILELSHLIRRKMKALIRTRPNDAPNGKHALTHLLEDYSRQFERLRQKASDRGELRQTLDYLSACFAMRRSSWNQALELLKPLTDAGVDKMLYHYDIPIASMALLRIAQCNDLRGSGPEARSAFRMLADSPSTPEEIRTKAACHVDDPYQLMPDSSNRLLREYNLELYKYKRPVYGRSESI